MIERKKDNRIAYINRAAAYIGLGDYEKAIDDCNKALEFQLSAENKALAYNNRSVAYEALGETTKAQADFVKAKQLGYKG